MEVSRFYDLDNDRSHSSRLVAGSTVFLIVFCIFTALRFWHLSYYCLDGDEIFSLSAARAGWGTMFSVVVADLVHPPFSYVVLKLWILLGGEGLFWLRLLPALLSVSAVVPFLLLCRELNLSHSAISLALYLIGVNGYLIYWAHDIRMYSLLLFITLLSYWLFARFVRAPDSRWKQIVPLLAVNLLLVYTHYFGWLVLGVQFTYLLVFARAKLLQYGAALCFWAAAFAPWAYAVKLAADERNGFEQNLGWIARPEISSLAWFYAMLNGDIELAHTTMLGLAIFTVPCVWWLARSIRTSDGSDGDRGLWLLAIAATLPVLAAFAASRILPQSIWGERHLVVAAVPYLILVAYGATKLRPALVRGIVIAALVGWAGLAEFHKMSENNRPAWDQVTEQMLTAEPTGTAPVTLYTFEKVVDPILEYYIVQHGDARFQIRNVASENEIAGDHFWVVLRTPTDAPESEVPNELVHDGYRIGPSFTSQTPLEKIAVFPVWKDR